MALRKAVKCSKDHTPAVCALLGWLGAAEQPPHYLAHSREGLARLISLAQKEGSQQWVTQLIPVAGVHRPQAMMTKSLWGGVG